MTTLNKVIVKVGTTTKELNPTIFAKETVSLNDFFTVLKNALPEIDTKEKVIFKVEFNGTKATLNNKKADLVKEMKRQILEKYPIFKDFEAVGSETKEKVRKFVTEVVKIVSNTSLEDTITLTGALCESKNIFVALPYLDGLCGVAENQAIVNLESLKAQAEAEALKTAPKEEATA